MNSYTANEILINAHRLRVDGQVELYEFVINDSLHAIDCVKVQSLSKGIVFPINNFLTQLNGVLFELNHVRVNPRLDNTAIIDKVTQALQAIGVKVYNAPANHSMAICYRPLGEIAENVRFHLSDSGRLIFLCPNAKLKAVTHQLSNR